MQHFQFPVFCRSFLFLCLTAALGAPSVPAQDPTIAFPRNYSVVFANKTVSVLRVHYGPHQKLGAHDHPAVPTIFVYLNDSGPVKFQHLEDPPFVQVRPPTHTGAFRVNPGRLERHTIENLGAQSSDFLRIELKQVPLGTLAPTRGKAPQDPGLAQDTVEYKQPALEIERVICAAPRGCVMNPVASPSLLVAFTSMDESTRVSGRQAERIEVGEVRWLPASESSQIRPVDKVPAHLLRILLPSSPAR